MQPRAPIFIVSKGRADKQLTARALRSMAVPFRVVVEEQEFDDYRQEIASDDLIVLDDAHRRSYDTFDDLGDSLTLGSGPARNQAWDIAVAEGHDWHWTMDDNIRNFHRFNRNLMPPVRTGTLFRAMEDFVERYTNVGMAGPNYFMFVSRKVATLPPFVANTRIYSCNLIRSDVPMRWRGRYNEDTDLSLRMLKARWCTILFNAFIQDKVTTMKMKGGNWELYKDGTHMKSQRIVDEHPDVARLAWRFGRVHHYVDYRPFRKLALRKRADYDVASGVDELGMTLRAVAE